MKGIATCKICGRDFALMKEDHYVAHEPLKKGALAALVDNVTQREYDAFDCPHCGCQYIAQERKVLCGCVCDDGEEYTGDCEFCKYDELAPDEAPCNECNHNNGEHNNFEPKEGHE